MFQKKDFGNVDVVRSLDAQNASASANGESVDTVEHGGVGVVWVVGAGASLTAANYYTLKVQDSDDGTAWADVEAGMMASGEASRVINATTVDQAAILDAYLGGKRYVRAVVTETGTGASLNVGAAFLLTRGQYT